MPTVNFSICQNFKISNLIFKCSKEEERSLEFVLVDQQDKHYAFPNLIPESNNYLFLKIDRFEKIISVEGEYIKMFKMKKKDLLNKNLYDIRKNKVFFLDFIKPLYLTAIRNGEAYQFSFKINREESDLVCSIYPCYIPGKTSSVDIVIRKPQITMTKESVDSYVLECSNVQKINSN
jgi:transcriptional regulator with PAS, ATPase and Fis domain